MKRYPVDSASAWWAAVKTVHPGDFIDFTRDVQLPADVTIPPGVTVDMGGHTVSPPTPDVNKPSGYRLFNVQAGDITIQNGTIAGAGWGVYTFYSCANITIRNVQFTDVRMAAIKLSALKGQRVDGIAIEDCTITATARPQTLIDLGPGAIGATSIQRVNINGPLGSDSNTACDGIAVEDGQGPISIENVDVTGVPGDGIDVKNSAPLVVKNVRVTGAIRNGIKLWCHSTADPGGAVAAASLSDATIKGCGLEGLVVAAGVVSVDRVAVESPTAAAGWGNGTGYPADITVRNSSFIRTGTSASWLMYTDGGDSRPLTEPAEVRFEDCTFWGGNTNNIFSPKTGNPQRGLSKTQALAGDWPPNFVRCVYAESAPVEEPPPVIPPPTPTAEQRITALEALYASQTQIMNVIADKLRVTEETLARVSAQASLAVSRWEALREALK
jgi:uncharacterized coiled-coil protein SlyX